MIRSPRFSIAGLMAVVLIAALGLAALRSGSETMASTVFLPTCGVLALGVVGVACGKRTERAWWVGFTSFGWGYLALAFWRSYYFPRPPTVVLLKALESYIGPPPPWKPGFHDLPDNAYWQV